MSFGFGVGDFLAVVQLASKIRKDFVEAPNQFKAICEEVRNLSFVLQDVDIDLSGKELNKQQQIELQNIANSCEKVLSDIENSIDKYKVLNATDQRTITKGTARYTWKRLKWEPNEIQEFRLRITSNIALLNTFNGRITRDSIKRIVQHQEYGEHQALLNWLSALDYGAQHSDYISRRQEGTGQWLLDSPEFQSWISGSKQTLFCPGIPGAGKTILASVVIEELYNRRRDDGNIGIAYFYCSFRRRYDLESMLASLLKQLASTLPNLPNILSQMYNEHRPKSTRPLVDELARCISSLVGQTGGFTQTFLVIDALDECQTSGGSRSKLLDMIFRLQEGSNVNLLTTSRFIPEIMERFESMSILEIRASRADVTRYVQGNLAILPPFVSRRQDLQEEISNTITGAVDGMFLLAQLYLNSLIGKRSPKAIRSALKDLSVNKEYEAAYDDAMKRIQGQVHDQSEMAMEVLAWITCAERPLTTIELQTALAVEIDESEFDEDNLPDLSDMVSVCAGLVTVDEQTNIIRLVHYTAQEYLERNQSIWFPRAHHDIGRTCVAYLSLDPFKTGHCRTPIEIETRLHNYPLFAYAGGFWGEHIRREMSDTEFEASDNPVVELISDIQLVNASAQMIWDLGRSLFDHQDLEEIQGYFCGDLYPVSCLRLATGLHLAVYFQLPQVLQSLISLDWPVDSEDAVQKTPLSWAAYFGLTEIASFLLENGANPDSQDGDGKTPMYLAAMVGQERIVQLLLDRGANPMSCSKRNASPLHAAATHGSTKVARLLLEQGIDPHLKGPQGFAPLWFASENGHTALAGLLLDWDSSVEPDNVELRYSMLIAAENDHAEVVSLLRDKGADPSATTKGRTHHPHRILHPTPLMLASAFGSESVVKLLLEWDVDLEAKDEAGRTALSIAISYYQVDMVRLLLEHNVNIEAKDEAGRTALSSAVLYGREEIVRILLERGADSDSVDNKGWTPFFYAASRPEGAILASLASFNTKGPHHRDQYGQTPLHLAASLGHSQSVRALLATEQIDLELRDDFGCTALSVAASYGSAEIVQLLVEKGADASSSDKGGRTAFFHAASRPDETILASLLRDNRNGLNQPDHYGRTPLLVAASFGRLQSVRTLLATEGIDCKLQDDLGRTALMVAVSHGFDKIVRLLLENGADSSSYNEDGRTAFFYAAYCSDAIILNILTSYSMEGSKTTDRYGRSPLHVAATRGNIQAVCALLAIEGMDWQLQDNFGRTALSDATIREQHDVVTALQNFGKGLKDPTPITKVSFANSEQRTAEKDCDICRAIVLIGELFYHCSVCRHGDFDICDLCHRLGARCLDRGHELEPCTSLSRPENDKNHSQHSQQ